MISAPPFRREPLHARGEEGASPSAGDRPPEECHGDHEAVPVHTPVPSADSDPARLTVQAPLPDPPRSEDRLRLRRFTSQDETALVDMHRDPRVREQLIDDAPFDQRRYTAAFLSRLQEFYPRHPGLGLWAAEHWVASLSRDDPDYMDAERSLAPGTLARLLMPRPRFVGWFNLMPMSLQPGEVELGARLVPSAWGTGLVMEGCALLLDHAFGTLRRDRVWASCHPGNLSAQLRLRMLGFRRDDDRPYEGWANAPHFVVDAQAWRQQKGRPCALRRREAMAGLRSQGQSRNPA